MLIALAVGAAATPAQYGQVPNVTINVSPNPVRFSTPVRISGRVRRRGARVAVALQARPVRQARFVTTARARADRNGRFRFGHRPGANIDYRVVAATRPSTLSRTVRVFVRMLVGFRASDQTPRRGARIRFSGIVRPPHDLHRVYIQKRAPSGRWVTVARTRTRRLDAESSRYSRRVRVRRSGVYRVRLLGHDDHAAGVSRERTLIVH